MEATGKDVNNQMYSLALAEYQCKDSWGDSQKHLLAPLEPHKIGKKIRDIKWEAIMSYVPYKFEASMREIQAISPYANPWLRAIPSNIRVQVVEGSNSQDTVIGSNLNVQQSDTLTNEDLDARGLGSSRKG
ncbi:hypothetical protein ACH5RR_015521 [Cinchona calisaya]|uniref:Uncharacterized protein n=1 Tax=Cinchona calisaya TaxID=153742 RepID=A0ABD2ZTD9_9GENT